jgi:hypothetical protein
VFYGSNRYRKDNPRGAIGNTTETPGAPDAAFLLMLPVGGLWEQPVDGPDGSVVARAVGRVRDACGIGAAWLIGLPRRAGASMHALGDAEAQWRHWNVTERHGGLVHQYRDVRFDLLRFNPAIRRDELRGDLAGPPPALPERPRPGEL